MSETNAHNLDQKFPSEFRNEFFIPKVGGKEIIYFTGNSLGLQPQSVQKYLQIELDKWQNQAVEAHFDSNQPWMYFHHYSKKTIAKLVGAIDNEVVMMNSLTVNLHLFLHSFYSPNQKRKKILIEKKAFSSDRYAVESFLNYLGVNPDEAIIYLSPQKDEFNLSTDEIQNTIISYKDELALVLLGGVNYYTGQVLDMKSITECAHQFDIKVGFDLAHAVGNVELKLHEWNIDFAVWCSYKYLNSGPGGVGGAFLHQNHFNSNLPRLAGWWGYEESKRFGMSADKFIPSLGVDGWQLSNAPILSLASLHASLEIFEKAGYQLFEKGKAMNQYLYDLLSNSFFKKHFKIISPSNSEERGCQLSLYFFENCENIMNQLREKGVICDFRQPNVIRIAPVPLYNTFAEIEAFANILKEVLTIS